MNIQDLLRQCATNQASADGKTYHPCRMQSAENTFLIERIKAAWKVLTGKADAIEWGDWE